MYAFHTYNQNFKVYHHKFRFHNVFTESFPTAYSPAVITGLNPPEQIKTSTHPPCNSKTQIPTQNLSMIAPNSPITQV